MGEEKTLTAGAPDETRVPREATVLICTRGVGALGAAMLSFGLDVWIYRQTGSYGSFALLLLLNFVPGLLLAPFIGMIVDRYNKRTVLIACELLALAAASAGVCAFLTDHMGLWSCAGIVLALALASSIRWAALGVTVTMLVPRAALGKANGLQQALQGLSDSAGPVMGAAAMSLLNIGGVLAVSFAAEFIALVGIVLLPAARLVAVARPARGNFWRDATFGFRWISGHRMLRGLLMFVAYRNLLSSVFIATFTPFLLSQASSHVLGVSWGLYGLGSCLMGAVLASGRGVQQSIVQVTVANTIFGIVIILWGAVRSPAAFAALAFIAGAQSSLIVAALQTIWQRSVPPEIQGRVFATRQALSLMLTPVGILASIPLATAVFRPLVATLPASVSIWTGPAANIGMMLSVVGVVLILGCSLIAVALRGANASPLAPAAAAT